MTSTFKSRVTKFWEWYPTVADRFFETIEDGRCEDLTTEVSQFMDNTLPHMAWVFGPGENGGHSFTVSGEGVVAMQLLAEYWHSRAVELPNWTFYGSRQPSPPERLKNMAIAVGEQEQVDAESFVLKTAVDEDDKLIHIVAWHPAFENLPEEHHYQILFLLLDEALGEFGVEQWLGEIQVEPFLREDNTRSLAELPGFIEHVNAYYRWEKLPPLEARTLYQLSEDQAPNVDGTPRADTTVGQTTIPRIVFDLLEHDGRLPKDPLEGTGAELVYVAIDSSVFPDGNQAEVRGNIEDALDEALPKEQSGRVLGGAFGVNESYIDIILFDGEASRRIVEETLAGLQLAGRSRLQPFV
jgi:hypothetical protein